MSDDETRDAEESPLPVEIGVAVVAGGLSWLATPAPGVVMHWGSGESPGWGLGAIQYGLVAAILTFLTGHFVSRWVSSRFGISFTWPAPAAAGVLWISLAGFQHIWSSFSVFAAATVFAVAVYFLSLRMAFRRPVPGDEPESAEPE